MYSESSNLSELGVETYIIEKGDLVVKKSKEYDKQYNIDNHIRY